MRTVRPRVGVIGAGTVGLACAELLASSFDVSIIARAFGVETASNKATAIWHIYLVEETPRVLSLAGRTLRTLYHLFSGEEGCGIGLASGIELFRTQPFIIPSWSQIPRVFEILQEAEIAQYNQISGSSLNREEMKLLAMHPVRWGYRIEAPVADMFVYLPWLESRVRSLDVNFVSANLESLDGIGREFDLLVNCAGAGAKELCKDDDLLPVRGQYFVLRGDDGVPNEYIGDDDNPLGMSYVIPRLGEVMIGGTAEPGIESDQFDLSWDDLQRRAALYAPWVESHSFAEFGKRQVSGVRPFRKGGLRLEVDVQPSVCPIIHNYGHGGSGFSLSWGCAEEVESMANALLN